MGDPLTDHPPAADELQRRADAALDLSVRAPLDARTQAEDVLARAAAGDELARSTAERALGVAARELNDLPLAKTHFTRAVDAARAAGDAAAESLARVKLGDALFLEGRTAEALDEIERAAPHLTGVDAVRLRGQRAVLLARLGRDADALAEYRTAIPALQRSGAALDEAQARVNRAILRTYRGEFAAAEADLRRADELGPAVGPGHPAGMIHGNLGFVIARRGDLPAALALFDRAIDELPPRQAAAAMLDRCEALLAVRVVADARAAADKLVALLRESGMGVDLAEALVMAAQAALLDGDGKAAEAAAEEARATFAAQDRAGWAALAGYVAMRGRWVDGRLDIGDLTMIRSLGDELDAAGWSVPALDARLTAARVALDHGAVDEARLDLEVAAKARRRGPADLRARAWHAEALLRRASGNDAGAERALRAGVRVLDEHRDTLGATELRVHAAARAEELAELGLRMAVESGRPERVLAWAERWRAGALRARPARPPDDEALGAALTELRQVAAELEAAALAGDDTNELRQRHAALERAIRDRARHGSDVERRQAWDPASVAEIQARLGEAALVEYVRHGDTLFAVTVTERRARLFPLVGADDVAREIESLRFSYTRLVRGHGSKSSIDTFTTTSDYATAQLDRWLIEPLRRQIDGAPLVIVPTGALHRVPWAGLPSCRGRTVSVAPSAASWVAAARRTAPEGGQVTLAAGPDVPNAAAEIEDLQAQYPDATVLTGAAATAAEVARALDGAAVAHVAAHGTFRSDNPLFSALQLADGDLTVYDLERLDRAPSLVVLSACDSGITDVRRGDELMGFAAAMFALGSRTLVASVVPVPDDATRPLMSELHRRLARGDSPAAALGGAQLHVSEELHLTPAATAGFVCLGA